MKAIILAAGSGRRIAAMGWHRPKCLLSCPGGRLLDNALRSIAALGITEVTLVTGYERQQVEATARVHPLDFRFVSNSEFDSTNTLYSAYLAREYLGGGAILLNADVWFVPSVLERLRAAVTGVSGGAALAVQLKQCGEEEVKITLAEDDRVLQIGKDLDPAGCDAEYVGIGWFGAAAGRLLAKKLAALSETGQRKRGFYEAAVAALLAEERVVGVRIGLTDAIEIDTPEDFRSAQTLWGLGGARGGT